MTMWSQVKILRDPEVVRSILAGQGNLNVPSHIQIEPTEACNLRCSFCHWHNAELSTDFGNFDFKGIRSIDTERLLDLIDEFHELGVKAVAFTGAGDPCVHKHLWKFLQRLRENTMDRAVTSNLAMPIKQELVAELGTANWVRWSFNAVSKDVFISVQGPKNGFAKAAATQEKNIPAINEARLAAGNEAINASFVISYNDGNGNATDIVQATRKAKELGCASISFRPDMPFSKEQEVMQYNDYIVEQLESASRISDSQFTVYTNLQRLDALQESPDKDLLCYYINHSTYIAATGDIYPCCYTRYEEGYVLGNILDQSFQKAWFSARRQNAYKTIKYNECPPCHHGVTNTVLKDLYGDNRADNFI
jgi:radical SAM protein with 4Fe4S-binding SPASM domain